MILSAHDLTSIQKSGQKWLSLLQLIRNLMDKAIANGLNVMRAFATAVDPWYAMETSPGIYNENVFRGLDYALEQARLRGIKVTHLALGSS